MRLVTKFPLIILVAMTSFIHASMKIELFQKEAVKTVRTVLDQWNIELWREYPYLYVFQNGIDSDYNSIFEEDPEAFVLFAERSGEKIGLLQANPLNSSFLEKGSYTPYEELDKFISNGFDPSKILYVSCFLMAREERSNLEAIHLLFERTIELAKRMGKTQICYMEIIEDENHPLRPVPYIPLEPWRVLGKNFRSMDIITTMRWPTLKMEEEVVEEEHQMAFYVMDIK